MLDTQKIQSEKKEWKTPEVVMISKEEVKHNASGTTSDGPTLFQS